MRSRSLILMAAVLISSFAACGEKGAATRKEIGEAVDAIKEYTFAKKDEYVARLKEGSDRAAKELAALEEKAKTAAADAKKDLEPRIAALKEKTEALKVRLEEAKSASAETWNATLEKAEAALEALKIETEKSQTTEAPSGGK